jgi:hypothetical protein
MFRLRMLPLALLAVLLVACQVTVRPPAPPAAEYTVNAQGRTTEPSPRRTIQIPANGFAVLEVNYPTAAADLMYLEIEPVGSGAGLQLEMWGTAGTALELVSRSRRLFATSAAALPAAADATATEAERSSISIGWTCFGPCVARSYRPGTTYGRVINTSASERTVRVYAYGLDETDQNEPNDTVATATPVTVQALGTAVTGAIERATDLDYFRIRCGSGFPFANLQLSLATGFDGDMVLDAAGTAYRPGQRTAILPCDTVVRVRTADGTAGPSSASTYSILIE